MRAPHFGQVGRAIGFGGTANVAIFVPGKAAGPDCHRRPSFGIVPAGGSRILHSPINRVQFQIRRLWIIQALAYARPFLRAIAAAVSLSCAT